jgi:cold shock CspA family protein
MELPNTFFNHDAQAGGFYPKSHVGIDISGFGRRQNVLIEGIRGTGKTHVLKMIRRYHLDNFEGLRVMPIYVSIAQLSEHARKEPDEFRLHLYAHIVQRCVETVEINRAHLQPDRNLLQKAIQYTARLFGIKSEPDIEDLLGQIKQTVEELLFKLQFDLTSENFKQSDSGTVSRSAKGDASLAIDTPGVKAGMTLGSQDAMSVASGSEATMNYVGSRLVHHNAAGFLVEFLKQIQIILNLDYSLILLDECSEASFQAQVEIFRLFKMIRGSGSQTFRQEACAYFIGTVYPRSETYYPARSKDGFSFEPGQDCTVEFLQWDETDLDTYTSFFQDMTLSRAREVINYQGDFESFNKALFDSNDAFLLAAYCAHGIPRRFWEITKRAYDPNAGQILHNRVSIAVQNIANEQILAHASIGDDDIEFIYSISGILAKGNQETREKNRVGNGSPIPQNIYFSVNRKDASVLNRLIMQGAIHDKSRMRTRIQPSRPQPIYATDMAVIYTFRIIPHEQFVKVVAHDLPRCPSSDFKQAPIIFRERIQEIYKTERLPPVEARIEGEADRSIEGRVEPSTGVVKSYVRGEGGYIKADDGGPDAMFQANGIEAQCRDRLKIGDKVRFISRPKSDGRRVAVGIVILGMKKRAEGTVKYFLPDKYGFIEVMDGGTDAYFVPRHVEKSIRTTLGPGDRVKFVFQ